MERLEFLKRCGVLEHARMLVKSRLNDFDLPYTIEEVDDLIKKCWSTGCCDEQNVSEIVLQHQYNIS